jgi:hypothetical protein
MSGLLIQVGLQPVPIIVDACLAGKVLGDRTFTATRIQWFILVADFLMHNGGQVDKIRKSITLEG